jgi:hypothetical protein
MSAADDLEGSMDMQPIGSTTGTPTTPGSQPQGRLAQLATALGVTPADLLAARRSGQSLGDFAAAKGISANTLQQAVVAGLPTTDPTGAPMSADQIGALASQIINRKPGGHHHHHGGSGAAGSGSMPDQAVIDAIKQALATLTTSGANGSGSSGDGSGNDGDGDDGLKATLAALTRPGTNSLGVDRQA